MRLGRCDAWHGALASSLVLGVCAVILAIVADVSWRGAGHWHAAFLTSAPIDGGRAGGILPILVSTAGIVAVCLASILPLGLAAAIYLAVFVPQRGLASALLRHGLDVLAAVPSIVFGLFGAAFFCDFLQLGYSLLAGGLTLACMILPLFIRLADSILRDLPADWRQAQCALGLSEWTFLRCIALPNLAPRLLAIVVLCTGRALAETAALLFTAGFVSRMPESLFDSGRSLSVHIYALAMHLPGGDGPAATSAMVLFALLAAITLSAQLLGGRISRKAVR